MQANIIQFPKKNRNVNYLEKLIVDFVEAREIKNTQERHIRSADAVAKIYDYYYCELCDD